MNDKVIPLGVIKGGKTERDPDDLALQLRQLADAVDRGEVHELIATYTQNDQYMSLIACSDEAGMAMSAIQAANAVDKLRSA